MKKNNKKSKEIKIRNPFYYDMKFKYRSRIIESKKIYKREKYKKLIKDDD